MIPDPRTHLEGAGEADAGQLLARGLGGLAALRVRRGHHLARLLGEGRQRLPHLLGEQRGEELLLRRRELGVDHLVVSLLLLVGGVG